MEKINYDKAFTEYVNKLEKKQKLLLHACCAPCSSSVLERVTPYFDVTLFFYNPNITEREEYNKRLSELYRFTKTVYGDKVNIAEGEFNPQKFFLNSKGLEDLPEGGKRCFYCYEDRLYETAKAAKVGLYDCYCTTLSVSPYKNAEKLNEIGSRIAEEIGVPFLPSDFKKKQGYVRSIELSKEYGLYRQNYCGCVFSYEAWQNKKDK